MIAPLNLTTEDVTLFKAIDRVLPGEMDPIESINIDADGYWWSPPAAGVVGDYRRLRLNDDGTVTVLRTTA